MKPPKGAAQSLAPPRGPAHAGSPVPRLLSKLWSFLFHWVNKAHLESQTCPPPPPPTAPPGPGLTPGFEQPSWKALAAIQRAHYAWLTPQWNTVSLRAWQQLVLPVSSQDILFAGGMKGEQRTLHLILVNAISG